MNFKKVTFVAACMFVAALNFSCEAETASEIDELNGIEKKELKLEDT